MPKIFIGSPLSRSFGCVVKCGPLQIVFHRGNIETRIQESEARIQKHGIIFGDGIPEWIEA
jgi:hypothetical protein